METLPFDLKTFPHVAAGERLLAAILPRWQRLWLRTNVIVLWAVLIFWMFKAKTLSDQVLPLLVILWLVSQVAFHKVTTRIRQKALQNAFSSRDTYTVRLDAEKITLASANLRRSYPRGVVLNVIEFRDNLLVVVDALSYIPVPPKAFADAASRGAFLAAVNSLIPAESPAP